jgi:hypothetical protein
LLPTHHQHCNLFALIVAIITLFFTATYDALSS